MPRPYNFPLQKVLDYRLQLEEEAKAALGVAQRAYQKQVKAVQQLRDALAAHEQSLYDGKELSPQEMWLWRNYKERLHTDLQLAEQDMLQKAKEVNAARRQLVTTSKDKKLLEKLKQNKLVRHVKEEFEKEQKEQDELATMRYGRDAY